MPLLVLEMKSVHFLVLTRISLFFLSTKTIFLLSISNSGTLQVFIRSGPSDEDLMFHSNSSESRWGKFSQSVETSKPFQVFQTDLAVTLEPRNIIYIFTCSLKNSCWSRQRLAEDSLPLMTLVSHQASVKVQLFFFFCCIPFFLSKASYRKYFVFFLTQLMKQIWGLWVARLRMAHVTGRTSVLASVGGWEEGTLLGIQDHPWTTLWALI